MCILAITVCSRGASELAADETVDDAQAQIGRECGSGEKLVVGVRRRGPTAAR